MKKLGVTIILFALMTPIEASWNRHNWGCFGAGALITGIVIGSVVSALPEKHEVIIINGNQYYTDGTYYYQETSDGYIVIEEPVQVIHVIPQKLPAVTEKASVIMQVPTTDDEIKDIQFIKKGSGFVGPNGEYYDNLPTPAQLKSLYGSD